MSKSSFKGGRSHNEAEIEQTAAEWFGRCEIGLTPVQEREFLRWLEADERHGQAMREMDETWEFLDRLRQLRRPGWASAEITRPIRAANNSRLRFVVLAAAALVMISTAMLWWLRMEQPLHREIATGADGMKKIDLVDGSVVHLNANSQIRIRFTKTERQVELIRGEAHFAVAKDVARPFVVAAGKVEVKAVGTAFNVRMEVGELEVLVLEGQVRVNDAATGAPLLGQPSATNTASGDAVLGPEASRYGSDHALLRAGQRVLMTHDVVSPEPVQVQSVARAEIERTVAWQGLQLDFDLTPLSEIVAQFNRHNSHQLVIVDSELATQLFGGTFRADNCDVFVQLLEERFAVKAERSAEQTLLRRAAQTETTDRGSRHR